MENVDYEKKPCMGFKNFLHQNKLRFEFYVSVNFLK